MKKIILLLFVSLISISTIKSQLNLSILSQRIAGSQDVPINSIVKNGNYLYVGSKFSISHLKTFDISNNTLSQLTHSVEYTSSADKDIQNMILDGNNLYISGSKGLVVFGLSNPSTPNLLGHVTSVIDGSNTRSINSASLAKRNNYMLIESGWSGCMLLDVTNPISPVFKSIISYTGVMKDVVFIDGTIAALIDGYNLYFINYSNPLSMTKITKNIFGDPKGMLLDKSKNILYITSETISKSYLFSFSTITQTKLDSIELTQHSQWLGDMSLKNSDTLLIGGRTQDIIGVKVSNATALQAIGTYSNSLYLGASDGILCSGSLVYACSYDDLLIYKWGPPTGLIGINQDQIIRLYPNPTTSYLNIENLPDRLSDVEIYNINGQLIHKAQVSKIENKLDLSKFNTGVYFIKMYINEYILNSKIVIQ